MATPTPQLHDALAALINHATTWANVQLPDVLQQMLHWQVISSSLTIAIALVLFLAGVFPGLRIFYLSWQVQKVVKSSSGESRYSLPTLEDRLGGESAQAAWIIVAVVGAIVALVCFCLICANVLNLLEVLLTPKAWLVDYIRALSQH